MVRLCIAVLAAAAAACVQADLDAPDTLPEVDESYFRCQVQPVLASSCAFMACHGNDERPLSVYAEQRYRLGITWDNYEEPLTADELAANLRAVRGFLPAAPGEPNLLSDKPLDTRAGGLFHRGRDLYGDADVFLDRDDPRYQVLRDLPDGKTDEPACQPREDLGL